MARHFGEQFRQDWCNGNCDICKKPDIRITQLDVSAQFEEIENILANAVNLLKFSDIFTCFLEEINRPRPNHR